jgi:hypothetical protein
VKCPYCGEEATCDEVDIEVGIQQCGVYGCDNCHAVQLDWRDEPWPEATDEERKVGWSRGQDAVLK